MYSLFPRPHHPRRGVTLIEMLVVVALLVLMMTIIVQIFQAATGSVSAAKAYQELDDELRELDATIRGDLQGVTARLNPPLDPLENAGYFEYIENSWPDLQGEDTDDCLKFTAKAPPGQPFIGRMYLYPPPTGLTSATPATVAQSQPILITSEFAEIIYFLRNGNLYRRVLLIAPERQQAVINALTTNSVAFPATPFTFHTSLMPNAVNPVSWIGVNDLSARPAPRGTSPFPILNTLGDLTNRENRAFAPRFCDDFAGGTNGGPDGIPDDFNLNIASGTPQFIGDGVPDYYPTLYPGVFQLQVPVPVLGIPVNLVNFAGANYPITGINATQFMAFPYIFPGSYSQVDPTAFTNHLGAMHVPDPSSSHTIQTSNHAPLDVGDSLLPPLSPQTWWGFPTWRETLSNAWIDPLWKVNVQGLPNTQGQTFGLIPFTPGSALGPSSQNLLPPANYWFNIPPYNDGAGTPNTVNTFSNVYVVPNSGPPPTPVPGLWEDDLIMTGVRSFDVKAYDDSVAAYVDLGNSPNNSNVPTNAAVGLNAIPDQLVIGGFNYTNTGFSHLTLPQALNYAATSFGHEGLMPSRSIDQRFDPQAATKGIFNNIGDDKAGTIRLRRTWDSWSTRYTEAPSSGYDCTTLGFPPYGMNYYPPPPNSGLNVSNTLVLSYPVYPSYPPPYQAPLRGLQIQLRVVDPRNERIKVLTIRQDFSDKIYNKQ